MSDPRAVVERYLRALGTQDWDALAATLARDVERTGPYNDVYRDAASYVAYLREVFGTLSGYELAVARTVVADHVVTVELSETVDTPQGRRRTDEAVVFDVSAAGDIRRIGVYIRR